MRLPAHAEKSTSFQFNHLTTIGTNGLAEKLVGAMQNTLVPMTDALFPFVSQGHGFKSCWCPEFFQASYAIA